MATTRDINGLISQIQNDPFIPYDQKQRLIQKLMNQYQQQMANTFSGGYSGSSPQMVYFDGTSPSDQIEDEAEKEPEQERYEQGDIVTVKTRVFEIIRVNSNSVDVIEISTQKIYKQQKLSQFVMKKKKNSKKITLAPEKLEPLVVKQEVKEEIVAVLEQYKNHDKLFKEWGLGEVIEYGRGMTFMFYGPPGTGKTWGATCISKALGLEMITLSPAEVQSSEPGGANRAIQQAFREATSKNKVIFIDECDSLITSRNDLGMVLASEVNTLLTEIEKFEGVAILATNRIEDMDEALERRISLIVEFPKPDYENRVKIWDKLLPKKLPLGKGVAIETLAKEELTGGQIKNVVLQASRMALSGQHDKVEQKHFELAIARIKKSKNLMGTSSRYRQGVVKDDFHVSSTSKTKIKDFLKTKEDADYKDDTELPS